MQSLRHIRVALCLGIYQLSHFTCRKILKLSQTQLDALKQLAIADLDAGDPIERVDYGEMYLENLSLLLFGKSCPHRTKDRVYFNVERLQVTCAA